MSSLVALLLLTGPRNLGIYIICLLKLNLKLIIYKNIIFINQSINLFIISFFFQLLFKTNDNNIILIN